MISKDQMDLATKILSDEKFDGYLGIATVTKANAGAIGEAMELGSKGLSTAFEAGLMSAEDFVDNLANLFDRVVTKLIEKSSEAAKK